MTNVQSKFFTTCKVTCKDFHHPWTDKCMNAAAGELLAATPYTLRVYTVVYILALVMKHRLPTKQDLRNTILGIIQSAAFLCTNAFPFQLFNCLLRNMFGHYYFFSTAFLPSFLASWCALLVERPARRPLLALYVANVATETLWNMAESRGYVRSIPQGQTLVFGVSVSILLYLYRLGLHTTVCKDSMFNVLSILVGKQEAGPLKLPMEAQIIERSRPRLNFSTISGIVQAYGRFIEALKGRHHSCPHKGTCAHYAIMGGIKPFLGGISLQVALKLVMNIKNIVHMKMSWRKTFWNKSTLNLGICLGSFSLLYKAVSCILRHGFDRDDPRFAIPAGLIGTIGFTQYPDVSVALYVMWKTIQIVYHIGTENGKLPIVPGFIFILYSFCTAILFHAGILEPQNLRPSYYKFLQGISGERLNKFNFSPLDVFGFNTSQNQQKVHASLNIVSKSLLPKFALA